MTAIPLARLLKGKWFQMDREHCFLLNSKRFKSILIGDSLMAGLHRYSKIWNYFYNILVVYVTKGQLHNIYVTIYIAEKHK